MTVARQRPITYMLGRSAALQGLRPTEAIAAFVMVRVSLESGGEGKSVLIS